MAWPLFSATTHEAVDAVVAFRILDAAGADDGRVDGSRGGKNLDAVDVELAARRWECRQRRSAGRDRWELW